MGALLATEYKFHFEVYCSAFYGLYQNRISHPHIRSQCHVRTQNTGRAQQNAIFGFRREFYWRYLTLKS